MNQGCHGDLVEMTGIPSASQTVATGFVFSGVEATSMRSILSSTISFLATSDARLGLDWLSFDENFKILARLRGEECLDVMASLSAMPASGPVSEES